MEASDALRISRLASWLELFRAYHIVSGRGRSARAHPTGRGVRRQGVRAHVSLMARLQCPREGCAREDTAVQAAWWWKPVWRARKGAKGWRTR